MLEKLFQQIAKRTDRPEQPSLHSFPQMVSDWFQRFGASGAYTHDPAWETAKQDYFLRCELKAVALDEQPEMFQRWTQLHRRIAELVALEELLIEDGLMHISMEGVLIAEINPSQRSAYVRSLYQDGNASPDLVLRRLPSSAVPLSQPEQLGFERVNLLTLLWHYAQTEPAAIEQLPPEVATHRLQLRRLPTIEPAALQMRHLRLFDAFKAGGMRFSDLRQMLPQDHWPWLCPDLAALHITGCLRFLWKSKPDK